MKCTVYRCSRQDAMYLYLREGIAPESLPEGLRQRAGALVQVMDLELSPERRLARVDTASVMAALEKTGWFLQLPPDGHTRAHLYFGD
jgi:uncharacterized protein